MSNYFKFCIKNLVRITPVISGLHNSRWKDHKSAFREWIITLLFTTLPLWVSGWIVYLKVGESTDSIVDYFKFGIDSGDLFLYSCSILAPIIYTSLCDPFGSKEFPSKTSHAVSIILIVVLSTTAFGLRRSYVILDQSVITNISMTIFVFSSALLYITLVYKNRFAPDGAETLKIEERSFANSYGQHR